jgi:hypothetical protein
LCRASNAGSFGSSGIISSAGTITAVRVAVLLLVLQRGGPLFALQQQLDPAEPALDLSDPGDDAVVNRMSCVGSSVLSRWATAKNEPVALDGVFNGTKGAGSACRDRCGDAGEHDRSASGRTGRVWRWPMSNVP